MFRAERRDDETFLAEKHGAFIVYPARSTRLSLHRRALARSPVYVIPPSSSCVRTGRPSPLFLADVAVPLQLLFISVVISDYLERNNRQPCLNRREWPKV